MKKLMFTAAMAAMTTGAFAGVAQVYDMTINVKSLTCKDNKKFVTDKAGNTYRCYRAQTSVKFEGKFWGCGCYTIANPIDTQYGRPELDSVATEDIACDNNNNSYMFWAPKQAFHYVDFKWSLLQLSGLKNENIEGIFRGEFFVCKNGTVGTEPALELDGAGYGTAGNEGRIYDEDNDTYYTNPLNYIKSMSGSVVGAFDVSQLDVAVGCAYCGGTCDCSAYEFCPQCTTIALAHDYAPAWGTFTLKYNSSLAGKINQGKKITEAYKFKDFVLAEFDCIAEGDEPYTPGKEEKLRANYLAAVQAVNVANQGVVMATANWVAATNEALRLNKTKNGGYDELAKLADGEGTTEGLAIYAASQVKITTTKKAYEKAKTATTLAQTAFEKSFVEAKCGTLTDAQAIESSAKKLVEATAAYNTAKAAYDEAKAAYDADPTQAKAMALATAKTKLAEAEGTLRDKKATYDEDIKKFGSKMTATVKTDLAKFESTYAAELEAEEAYNTAVLEPELTTWLKWGQDVEGSQYAAYLAAEKAATEAKQAVKTAEANVTAAKLELQQAETACLYATGSKDCQ